MLRYFRVFSPGFLFCLVPACISDQSIGSEVVFPSLERETSQLMLGLSDEEGSFNESASFIAPEFSLTEAGLELLKISEGELRCKEDNEKHCPYNDSSGFCTIGHGHLIAKAKCESILPQLSELGYLDGIDNDEAEEVLKSDLVIAQAAVESQMGPGRQIGNVDLTEYQYDSLVSLTFNIGSGNFRSSTLLDRIKAREEQSGNTEIAYQFSRWRKSDGSVVRGLVNRRNREVEHFFIGFEEPYLDWDAAYETAGEDDWIDIKLGE